ncbi:MAG: hypothetical protein ACETWM_13075 [Candidatus Lokiarchaeia archaeon]
MDLWNEKSVETVYGWLRVLVILVAMPAVVSALILIIQGNSIFLVPISPPPGIPPFLIVSPLTITLNLVTVVSTVTTFTLLLTAIFLISLAGVAIVGWYIAFLSFVRYTPGYNNFGDVKRRMSHLLHGTRKDKEKLTLFAGAHVTIHIVFTLFFVTRIALIFPKSPLELIGALLLILYAIIIIPSYNYLKDTLNR